MVGCDGTGSTAPEGSCLGRDFFFIGGICRRAVRPPTPLARAIVVVLVLKLFAIISLKLFMFPDDAARV